MTTKLSDLPDGWVVAYDTETSGTHPDDPSANVSVVSWAYRDPAGGALVQKAVAFDQGQDPLTVMRDTLKKNETLDEDLYDIPFGGLPLGPKDLPKNHSKRIRKWVDEHGAQILQAPNLPPSEFGRLLRQLRRMRLVGHNLKFDLLMCACGLRDCRDKPPEQGGGLDLSGSVVRDTQITQHVIDPRNGVALKPTSVRLGLGSELGLDAGSEDAEQQAMKPWLGGKNDPRYDLVPWHVIRLYAALDAALTLLLDEYQCELLSDEAFQLQARHAAREFKLMLALYGMETRGIGYDVESSRAQVELIEKMCGEIAQQLPFKPTTHGAKNYFFGPVETGGLGRIPYNDKITKPSKTHPQGQPQIDEEVTERLRADGAPFAAEYARYAELQSAASKWYRSWADLTGNDGRLRTNHKQTSVISGRLSVSRAQLQAIPQPYIIPQGLMQVRQLFVPKEGYGLWEADVSQAEIRIATALARCQPMLDEFIAGNDSHSAACWLMFRDLFEQDGHSTLEQASQHPKWDEFRQVAKRAQPEAEPVATPDGWKRIGDLRPGDSVIGSDGQPTKVRAIPYEGIDEVWEVTTKSGRVTYACADHLWTVRNGRGRWSDQTTRQLAENVISGARDRSAYLPASPVVEFDPVDLPIDPYLLGVLLGDGSFRYTNPKWYSAVEDGREIAKRLAGRTPDTIHETPVAGNPRAARFSLRGGHTNAALVRMTLLGLLAAEKFVPERYLRGSVEQRYELLRGLMDTDGCATKNGQSNVFSSTSRHLVDAVADLARSLGGVATVSEMHASRTEINPSWAKAWFVRIRTPECPYSLSRKVDRWKPPTLMSDRIVSVRPTGEHVPMRCITVEAKDGLYLTRDYVVTHNCNLGILYGAGAKTVQGEIAKFTGRHYPLSQVSEWIRQWKAAFPQFVRFLDQAAEKAAEQGWVRLVNGRERWFSAYEPTHKAANQIIQGSQAEVIKDVIVRVDNELPGSLLLTIHDSVVCEFPIETGQQQIERVAQIMVQEFERTFSRPWKRGGQPVRVPFVADTKTFGRKPEPPKSQASQSELQVAA